MVADKYGLAQRFAARCLSENWGVVLGVAEAIRSRGVSIPQAKDAEAVEEYFKAHVPVAVWETAQGYVDAVVEEWNVAAGGLSARDKQGKAKDALSALLSGDQAALVSHYGHSGVEGAQMAVMQAQAAVEQAKDQRQRAEAQSRLEKAQKRCEDAQQADRGRRLAALMIILGPDYSLAGEYDAVEQVARAVMDSDEATGRDGEGDKEGDDADFDHGQEAPKVAKSPILPKFLKK